MCVIDNGTRRTRWEEGNPALSSTATSVASALAASGNLAGLAAVSAVLPGIYERLAAVQAAQAAQVGWGSIQVYARNCIVVSGACAIHFGCPLEAPQIVFLQ